MMQVQFPEGNKHTISSLRYKIANMKKKSSGGGGGISSTGAASRSGGAG
jgi:hypothetical protein